MNKEMENRGTQGIEVDVNMIIRKLSLQIADLVSEKTILEAENEVLKERLANSEEK